MSVAQGKGKRQAGRPLASTLSRRSFRLNPSSRLARNKQGDSGDWKMQRREIRLRAARRAMGGTAPIHA